MLLLPQVEIYNADTGIEVIKSVFVTVTNVSLGFTAPR